MLINRSKEIFSNRSLTFQVNFMEVESVEVMLVSSTTSPDSRLALASLRSSPDSKSV